MATGRTPDVVVDATSTSNNLGNWVRGRGKPVLLVPKILEQPQPVAQQHRHNVDRQFVDRPAPQQRLNQRGAPHYGHLPAAGGGLGLGDRAVEPVTHESEGQPEPSLGCLAGGCRVSTKIGT